MVTEKKKKKKNAGFQDEFGYGKYLIAPFLVRFGSISSSFGLTMGILARLRLAKIRTMARPNSPDMPPKRTKKVRLGISISTSLLLCCRKMTPNSFHQRLGFSVGLCSLYQDFVTPEFVLNTLP